MKFVLLIAADEGAWRDMAESDRADAIARISAWYGKVMQSGSVIDACRLSGAREAVLVGLGPAGNTDSSMAAEGSLTTHDLSIGSYIRIDVPDMDAAVEFARTWPAGGAIEIRPVAE